MPPGIGYGKKLGLPNEQDMFGDALMQQFGEGAKIDGTGRTMPGGGVVGPQPGANQTQPFGAPQKIADPSMPSNPSAPASGGRTGFGGMSLDNFSGNRSPMNFSGFNTERAFAGGDPDSVKDGFARTVAGLDVDLRGLSKEQVGQTLGSTVVPALNAQGIQARIAPGSFDVIEVFSNERGWEPIDVVKNAGSDSAEWAWQDLMGGAGAGAPQAAAPQGGGSLNSMFGQVGNDATMAAILAEIEKYIDPQQMQALLGGALFEQMQGGQEPLL